MKISGKLIAGFSVVLIAAAAIGAAGFLGMRELRDSGNAVIENQMRGALYLSEAEAHFSQTQLEHRNALLNSQYNDSKAASDSREAFELSADNFMLSLGAARDVADFGELLAFYDRISELFENEYLPKASENIETCIDDIPEHRNYLYVYARLASADEDAAQITDLLNGAAQLNLALAEQTGIHNTQLTRTYILILLSLMLLALVLVVTASILTIRSIRKAVRRPTVGAPKGVKKADGKSAAKDAAAASLKSPGSPKAYANVESSMAFPEAIEDDSGGRFIAPDARVLVVDDSNADLKAVEILLRPYNIKVDLVNSGVAAVQAVQFGRYDIVFMDHKMPGVDGVEAARRIRMMGKTELPIVVLTDNAFTDIMETYPEYGFNDFLSKPISSVILDTLLRKWIPKSKRRAV